MEIKGRLKNVYKNWESGRFELTFEMDEGDIRETEKIKGKVLRIAATIFRNRRSLDANAYAWVLMQKIAEINHTDKDRVYLEMLGRYGQFTHVVVQADAVDRVKAVWRHVRDLGEITVGTMTGVQLQCYFGSSTYDTREMSVFIDGLISECKDLAIETATPDELIKMKQEWGV